MGQGKTNQGQVSAATRAALRLSDAKAGKNAADIYYVKKDLSAVMADLRRLENTVKRLVKKSEKGQDE